jgi:hypothetical protein
VPRHASHDVAALRSSKVYFFDGKKLINPVEIGQNQRLTRPLVAALRSFKVYFFDEKKSFKIHSEFLEFISVSKLLNLKT